MFHKSPFWWVILATAATFPGAFVHLFGPSVSSPVAAFFFGTAILGAAFLVTWAAETTEHAVRLAVVIAIVALIAVLPEYGVDMTFTWKAGKNFSEYGEFPVANMTGANRLLIGIGWPLVLLVLWLKTRARSIELAHTQALEIGVLALATLYAFVVVLKGNLALYDCAVFLGLFGFYFFLSARMPSHEELEPVGPVAAIVELPAAKRIAVVAVMFIWSIASIAGAAEPFAESLVHSGTMLGVDEFLLVQWVAPLASEAPEAVIALLFVLHARPAGGLGMLVSSKVNQWTLLVGMIPLVYAISVSVAHGNVTLGAFPLSGRQQEEILLTAAQSLFAITLLLGFRFVWWEALVLFVLFMAALVLYAIFPVSEVHYGASLLYVILSAGVLWKERNNCSDFCRTFWRVVRNPRSVEE